MGKAIQERVRATFGAAESDLELCEDIREFEWWEKIGRIGSAV